VLASRKLRRDPVRVEVAGRAFVLFRDAGGHAAALVDRCPHRFAPLSRGSVRPDGRLACPYHGWNFDADGRGASPSQPELARCDVEALEVCEEHGYVWIASRGTPRTAMPRMDVAGWTEAGRFDVLFRAPLHVALDNFSENEHTPWVHTRLGWSDDELAGIEFETTAHEDRTEVSYSAPQRRSIVARVLMLRAGDRFHNRWVTRFDPVRTEYTISWTCGRTGAPRPITTRAVIFMVPETDRTTRFHVFAYVRLNDERFRPLLPVFRRSALALGWLEVLDDARFIPTVADTPEPLRGMRLGRFDKPLVHNRKLLDRIYWGRDEAVDGALHLPVEKAS
jgi:phenylpropionate dioxygenase-like ring-hydroxylating dioxygenase large terminal subunit